MRRSVLVASVAAAILVSAAPAGAATTLRGRVLGRPQVSGAHAQVPVLLGSGAEVMLTVPATSGFRTVDTGRTRAGGMRLGDAVRARVRAVRAGRASARYLVVVARSAAPSFGALAKRLSAASSGAQDAAGEVRRISAAEASGPQDPGTLRTDLLALRYQLNLLISGLRDQADGMDTVITRLAGAPRAGDLVHQLRDSASGARTAATRLEDGVTGLDEFINSIGGDSAAALPVGSVSEVGQLLNTALQVLDGLDPQDGLPGGPTLPDPLGGVAVPVPPVLPG